MTYRNGIVLTILLLGASGQLWSTKILHKKLPELIKRADHVFAGRIVKVDMIQGNGDIVTNPKARTGPGLKNKIRLHIAPDRKAVLKGNGSVLPRRVIVELWPRWHKRLGTTKKRLENRKKIFLLKGRKFKRVYPGYFLRELSEEKRIRRIIRNR